MLNMTTETAEAKKPKRKAAKTVSTIKLEKRKKEAAKDLGKTYNEFKEFEGRQYTGMRVGRSHKWYYDKGEWKETKITPDLWEISYAVTKRRAGRLPRALVFPLVQSITGTSWLTKCKKVKRQ